MLHFVDSPCTLTWPQLHFKTNVVCTACLDKNKVVACGLLWMTEALFVFSQWFARKLLILEVKIFEYHSNFIEVDNKSRR